MGNVMKKTLIGFFVLFYFTGFVFAEVPTKPLLTLETAKIMANECLNLAKENNIARRSICKLRLSFECSKPLQFFIKP